MLVAFTHCESSLHSGQAYALVVDTRVVWESSGLLPCAVSEKCASVRSGRLLDIGAPHLGHVVARRETSCPQSGQSTSEGRRPVAVFNEGLVARPSSKARLSVSTSLSRSSAETVKTWGGLSTRGS